MNYRSGLKILLATTALAIGVSFVSLSALTDHRPTIAKPDQTEIDPTLAKIAKYKQWTLVNPTPAYMMPAAAQDCAVNPGRMGASPHVNKYVSVYVNQTGADALLHQSKPSYPVGSLIVKEKLTDKTSKEPELLTAMLKREKGFDAASGDWEYLVLDGKATTITKRGKLASCNSCHTLYRDQDYVTRSYLPLEIEQHLK